jgi:hypothetical protein
MKTKIKLKIIKNSCKTKKGCSIQENVLPYLEKKLKIAA